MENTYIKEYNYSEENYIPHMNDQYSNMILSMCNHTHVHVYCIQSCKVCNGECTYSLQEH